MPSTASPVPWRASPMRSEKSRRASLSRSCWTEYWPAANCRVWIRSAPKPVCWLRVWTASAASRASLAKYPMPAAAAAAPMARKALEATEEVRSAWVPKSRSSF